MTDNARPADGLRPPGAPGGQLVEHWCWLAAGPRRAALLRPGPAGTWLELPLIPCRDLLSGSSRCRAAAKVPGEDTMPQLQRHPVPGPVGQGPVQRQTGQCDGTGLQGGQRQQARRRLRSAGILVSLCPDLAQVRAHLIRVARFHGTCMPFGRRPGTGSGGTR